MFYTGGVVFFFCYFSAILWFSFLNTVGELVLREA